MSAVTPAGGTTVADIKFQIEQQKLDAAKALVDVQSSGHKAAMDALKSTKPPSAFSDG